ncbi:MAG: hypothetical protein UZ14_CFX002001940 [Chloroflexi bacterium OLB14]|nr:MAG: hypothetical protein UZ14_CFX002001940 [Chloroflexi bacterium OLB14]
MPFYLRKSINAGIFRFNLSKSGLGVSTGIRGFRIGSGPSGNYIHMGRNGLYYRSTWSGKGKNYPATNQSYYPPSLGELSYSQLTEIESADVLQFQDASSEKLISEINQKYKVTRYWLTVTLLSMIGLLASIIPIEWLYTTLNWDFTIVTILGIYCLGFPLVIVLSVYLYYLNQEQSTIILFYTMDNELENAYQAVHNAFSKLQSCRRSWHLYAQGSISGMHERKLSSGANTLINRQHITLSNSSPERIKTNIAVPSIPVGKQILYLFPDQILIREGNRFGAIRYSDVGIKVENSRFIESGILPDDAKVVGQTWKYPNKDGSPDRRFSDNHEIPIVLYNEVHLTSSQGLNEIIQLSKTDVGIEFAEAIKKLGKVTKDIQEKRISQPVATDGDMEKDIMEFYSLLGYTILRTRRIGDFTLDILLTGKKKEKWIARFENQNVTTPEIMRNFQNMVNQENPLKAGLIINGSFAPNTKEIVADMIKDKKSYFGR